MNVTYLQTNTSWLTQNALPDEDLAEKLAKLARETTHRGVIEVAQGVAVFHKVHDISGAKAKLHLRLGTHAALRAYANAFRLQKKGIATPTPVLIVRLVEQNRIVFFSEALTTGAPLAMILRQVFANTGAENSNINELFRALSTFLYELGEKGVYHSDLHDLNIWVQRDQSDKYLFYLVDLEAVRFCRKVSFRRRLKNAIRLTKNIGYSAVAVEADGEKLGEIFAEHFFLIHNITPKPEWLKKLQTAARKGLENRLKRQQHTG
jgi:hypothetical protein